MASISKIRYTNVIYENGGKRYNDEIFTCAGHNTAILLENGGGKTVFIQAALQAILPHTDLGERKAKETFVLEGEAAHIAIEWIISDKPRRYGLTAVTLYTQNNELKSYKYAYAYGVEDNYTIEDLPFTREENGVKRSATRVEMNTYYQTMSKEHLEAKNFSTTKDFHRYIEEQFKIIPDEWRSITVINGGEGSVEAFFDGCKTTADLVEKLLLPTVEQGLVGEGSEAFANTFESQRDHFNKHKQLERSIKESEKIKAQIEHYVSQFGLYNENIKAYENKKQEAKAVWQLLDTRKSQLESHLASLEIEKKQIENEKRLLEKENAKREVGEAQAHLEQAKREYEEAKNELNDVVTKKEEKEYRRHTLKLSRFQSNMKEAEAKIKLYEEQLARLDEDEEIEDLKEALEENSGKIKGHFVEKLEAIRLEASHCDREKEQFEEDKEKKQNQKMMQEMELQNLKKQVSKLTGKREQQEKQMQQIQMTLRADGVGEDIERETQKWQKRLYKIETNKPRLKQNIKENENAYQILNETLETETTLRMEILKKQSHLMAQVNQFENAQSKVLQELKESVPLFSTLESLYLKPQQVLTTLEEQIEKLTREKEEALLWERRHAYFLEHYANHEYFTVEPLLEKWVEAWHERFTFIQTGTAFIQTLENEDLRKTCYQKPKWTSLVVVADEEVSILNELLQAERQHMTYPVGIIAKSEAIRLLTSDKEEEDVIYPVTWSLHMQPEQFETYKQEAEKTLKEATLFRWQKEKELSDKNQLLVKVQSFLKEYTHEIYVTLRDEASHLNKEEAEKNRHIEQIKTERIKKDNQIRKDQETLRKEAEEKNRLQGYIEKTNHYLHLKRENKQDTLKIQGLDEKIQEQNVQFNQTMRDLERIVEGLEEAKERLSYLKSSENRIKEDSLYHEVKEKKAVYSQEELIYLKAKQEQLKESLSHKQKGRNEIQLLLKQSKKAYEENAESFRQEQAEKEIERTLLPAYEEAYGFEIEKLTEELKQLKIQLLQLDKKAKEVKTEFDKKEQVYQTQKEQYRLRYGEIEAIRVYQEEEYQQLIKKQQVLREHDKQIIKQLQNTEKELKMILEHQLQMDKKDEVFGFGAPHIEASTISEEMKQGLMYDLQVRMIVRTVLEDLEKLKRAVETSQKEVEEEKSDFKLFCQKEITNSKLRNMALQGIIQKQNYVELVEWTNTIVERVNQTLTILERDLLDQDQQISQFMIHLYAYLKTVATELAEIPKKTRVCTEEGWKMIYEFVIPSWQEESGKEKIRSHIYQLLDEMEGDHFKDETGKEDSVKMKKYIKEQFKLRTLLKVVMGNDAIRVRCRKVSNIHDISSQKYAWETSNKWSGGEKWSKNMALYLGILNYLAEKKQNIQNESQKVSRAVILDNPFGKASSGHVLEPVFFIAKELGFQIIALTAHSEGDFIRRYFPIVYSCKLRSTMNHRTSIFTKEQEIKKAYFVDNDPVALSILGSNQMGLF